MRSPSTTGIDRPSITPFFCQTAAVVVMSPMPAALNTVADPIDVLSRFSSDCEMITVSPSTSGAVLMPRRESLKFHTALPVRGWKFQTLPSLDPKTSAAWPPKSAIDGVL
jgi:hypothetical protein